VARSELSVSERLRLALTLDFASLPHPVDMSPRAITSRVLELCEMTSACLELEARVTRVDVGGTQ
jgi:hypothetical protein